MFMMFFSNIAHVSLQKGVLWWRGSWGCEESGVMGPNAYLDIQSPPEKMDPQNLPKTPFQKV